MVRPVFGSRFAEPMLDISLVRRIAIAHCFQRGQRCARGFEIFDRSHDVDDWLGGKPRHCSTSDVLNTPDEPWREHSVQELAFCLEPLGPGWVIRFELNWGVQPR